MPPVCPVCGSIMERSSIRTILTPDHKIVVHPLIMYSCYKKGCVYCDNYGKIYFYKNYRWFKGEPGDGHGIQIELGYI